MNAPPSTAVLRILRGLRCWLAAASCALAAHARSDDVVLRVNGEPVAAAELQRAISSVRASSYADAAREHVPAVDLIRERALATVVRTKVQQCLMRDHGVWPEIDHAAFASALERENARRRAALAAGAVIYGPREFTADAYFAYLFSNAVLRLKAALGAGVMRPSDDGLLAVYERRKAVDFTRGRRVDYLQIVAPFGGSGVRPDERQRLAAHERIMSAEAMLRGGANFRDVAARFAVQGVASQTFGTEADIAVGKLGINAVAQAAQRLKEGETSGILESHDAYAIIHVLSRDRIEYVPFSECREVVRQCWVDEQYERRVAALVGAAKVDWQSAEWGAVAVQ